MGAVVSVDGPVVHGGHIYHAAEMLGRPVESFLDFSASIHPLGPPASVLRAVQRTLPACGQYPDPSAGHLRRRLAAEYGLSPDSIVVGNGSAELIRVLPQALALRQGYVAGPTFREYEESLHLAGVPCTLVSATSDEQYAPPVECLLNISQSPVPKTVRKGLPSAEAVFVCNPNNPTGRMVTARRLRRLYRQLERAGYWMVVDEAFIEFCPAHSLIRDIPAAGRLLILRSFTKFFGMPGIRLGFLAGAPEAMAAVRRLLPPWSVSQFAQAAGVAALNDTGYRQRSLQFIQHERPRLMTQLRRIGLRVIPSSANFVMLELPSSGVVDHVVGQLAHQGILVRDCRTFNGMSRPALRVAVRRRRDNLRLVRALQKAFQPA